MHEELLNLIAGRRGHFRMESGLHSEWWFELGRLFERPERVQPHVTELARRLAPHRIDAVCGPMSGGARLAEMLAPELGAKFLFAKRREPPPGDGLFRVPYRLPDGMCERASGLRVAIVDDAISAGSAVRGTHAGLIACGATPVVLGALIVFGEGVVPFATDKKLTLEAVARMPFGMWKPAECPLCAAGVAVERISDAV